MFSQNSKKAGMSGVMIGYRDTWILVCYSMLEPAPTSSQEPVLHISSQHSILRLPIGSLKLAIVFAPCKLAKFVCLLSPAHPESQLLNAYHYTTGSPLSGLEWFPADGGFNGRGKSMSSVLPLLNLRWSGTCM